MDEYVLAALINAEERKQAERRRLRRLRDQSNPFELNSIKFKKLFRIPPVSAKFLVDLIKSHPQLNEADLPPTHVMCVNSCYTTTSQVFTLLDNPLQMSLNTAHADHGVLIHAGECIILFSDNVNIEFYGNDTAEFKGTKNGRMYLTTHRMIYNSKSHSDAMRSFSFPFIALEDVSVEQPLFGANFIKGKVRAQPNGNFIGEVKFKLTFKSGGAIEFGQAMLKAAHLASRYVSPNAPPPSYTPQTGPWMAAPPPAYAPPVQGYYGWLPPYSAFPDQPPPNSVFVSSNPPPYPGVTGGPAYPPMGNGFSGQGGPPPSYPGNSGYPGNTGYPGNSGYSDNSGYPGNPGNAGYPGNPGNAGYPGNPGNAGFAPPPGYPGGFTPSAPGAPGNMSSRDAKAAEAAQSAYYDPNKPQTAYVPPPYDQPPTYQESTSKKQN